MVGWVICYSASSCLSGYFSVRIHGNWTRLYAENHKYGSVRLDFEWERRMYSKSSASNFERDAVIIGFDPSSQGWTLSCSSRLQFKIPHWDSTTVANARRASVTLLFWAGLWAPDVSQQETSGPNAVQHTHARATWYRVCRSFDHEFPWHFQLFEFSARPH